LNKPFEANKPIDVFFTEWELVPDGTCVTAVKEILRFVSN